MSCDNQLTDISFFSAFLYVIQTLSCEEMFIENITRYFYMPFPAIHNSWLLILISCWRNLKVAMFVCLFVCFSFYVSMVSVVSKVKICQGQGNVFIKFDEKMSETDYWTDPSDTNQTLKLWGRARDSDMCCCITFFPLWIYHGTKIWWQFFGRFLFFQECVYPTLPSTV